MPYREKTSWLSLIAIVATFGPYFVVTGAGWVPDAPLPNLTQMGMFATAAVVQMLILGGGYLYLARATPGEARMPPDERDREIMYRARTIAYYVLISGTIVVGCVMPFVSTGWKIVNATVFMIALAEVVQYGLIIGSYRWQA